MLAAAPSPDAIIEEVPYLMDPAALAQSLANVSKWWVGQSTQGAPNAAPSAAAWGGRWAQGPAAPQWNFKTSLEKGDLCRTWFGGGHARLPRAVAAHSSLF